MGFTKPMGVAGFLKSDVGSPSDAAQIQQALAVTDDLPWVDVASATTTSIGAANSNKVRVTGTTTITGLGTVLAGVRKLVRFAAALTLTHNGTSLILPGSANITTAANDTAEFVSLGSGNWLCVWYKRASGLAIAAAFSALSGSASIAQLGSSTYSVAAIEFVLPGVDFNSANTDNPITISLPAGYTRYRLGAAFIYGASQTLTTATCALFTEAAGAGTAIIASGTAITVNTASALTNTGLQSLTLVGTNTQFLDLATFPTLYFRVQTAQGAAATGNFMLQITPLP